MNKKNLIRIVLLLLLIGVSVWVGLFHRDQITIENIQALLNRLGIWAPIIFILIYALATVVFLPGSILTLAGGFIFGPLYGAIYNIIGATLGATLAFLVSRYIASDWVAEKVGGRLQQLKLGIEKAGWRFVALVRLVPLFPFNLLNYALGLTKIRIIHYVLASAVFMLPGSIAYTYVGSLGQSVLAGDLKQTLQRLFIAVGLLIIVASIPWFVKHFKKDKL